VDAGTIVAGASHFVAHYDPKPSDDLIGYTASCTLDGKGGAGCQLVQWFPDSPTGTTSFTGIATPLATLTIADEKNAAIGGRISTGTRTFLLPISSLLIFGVLFL
jgi:hypothetical protein